MSVDSTVFRWNDLPLEKVTEMISRKIIAGHSQMLVQVYLKRGAQIPMHSHENEQMVYVLQGMLRCLVGRDHVTVREGEVLHIPSGVRHQVEAVEDTFELVAFTPIRDDWVVPAS